MSISTTIENVTPEVAKKFLAKNMGNNRNLNVSKVSTITKDMIAGKWHETGDAIRFDKNGELIDGQHRLTALVNAGATLDMVVVRGLEPDVRFVIDTGTKRTPSDVLQMAGVKNQSVIKAAVARLALGVHLGQTERSTDSVAGNVRLSSEDLIAWVKDNDAELEHSVKVGGRLHKWWGRGSQAGIIYAHLALSRVDATKADKFFDELSTGVGSPVKAGPRGYDARVALAKTFTELHKNSISSSGAAPVYVYLILAAYEAWDAGKTVSAVIPYVDKKTGEGLKFPKILTPWWI